MLSILFGLGAALGWGAADFTGGLVSRKVNAIRVVLFSELIGIPVVALLVAFKGEALPDLKTWLLAMLAGAVGTFGLLLLYHALTLGLMSIATPVSALLAAVIPVLVGMFSEGLPNGLTVLGFAFALFAVWMLSQGEDGVANILAHLADLKLPLLAGVGFGSYFFIMHEATKSGATLIPMIGSRAGGVSLILIYLLFTKAPWKVGNRSAWGLIALNSALDICGNTFFILAGQMGRLDVAAVLSALYPGATVMLAWIILKERLSRYQWIGVISALIAIVLMTINEQTARALLSYF